MSQKARHVNTLLYSTKKIGLHRCDATLSLDLVRTPGFEPGTV